MKKIILTTLISFGLAFAANAQKKGNDKGNNNRSSHQTTQKVQKNHSPQNNTKQKVNKSHNSHNKQHVSYTTQKIWVAGSSQRVWVPPRYEYKRQRGVLVRVCVSHGHYETVRKPGYYTYKRVPVKRVHAKKNHNSGINITFRF